ncbi:HEAT repeat domain-containing protein [Vitiosangium sp. GDMCC 1.1324]|uniref:HEAT repeat domain-containing protein n=1 Tax=Vitiosangium sp. (strain GDMCC 1.1324) TaxID=2138576 RepID=UPI000D367444|nr:HEAT repeat domain-containing protein [Vitiosangium sp. GDMCC 1.1324]PTL78564.1 HEAT repeat domain-containing protein [Vitiosangium sp. GDMCC 1.1324]
MRRPLSLITLLLFTVPGVALAQVDSRTASLSKQLGQGQEPRLRSQAAQGLGSSDDPEALKPLCNGLKDSSEQVRAASAQALGKLKELAGLECLKARKSETDAATQAAIQTSIQVLQGLKEQAPRLYVMFAGVKDKTGGLRPEVVKFAEARMRRKLTQVGALLAPAKESKSAAQGVLRKHGIHGFKVQAEIHDTESGGLKVRMVCIGYPDQALLGDVEVQASGAKPEDLLKVLAPRIIEEAADTFEWDT